jgi:hypothetical protein
MPKQTVSQWMRSAAIIHSAHIAMAVFGVAAARNAWFACYSSGSRPSTYVVNGYCEKKSEKKPKRLPMMQTSAATALLIVNENANYDFCDSKSLTLKMEKTWD